MDTSVREDGAARTHINALLGVAATRSDPLGVLESLRDALKAMSPHDAALPWLQIIVGSVVDGQPLSADCMVPLVRHLRTLQPPPRPAVLRPYVAAAGQGLNLLTGYETLPEILARIADLRHDLGRVKLAGFLQAFTSDEQSGFYDKLEPVRELLRTSGIQPCPTPETATADTGDYRLIVQIRLEELDAPHVEDGQYSLQATCYRQPRSGGAIVRVGALGQPATLARSELLTSGTRPLSEWTVLAEELEQAHNQSTRIEFLLPAPLLGHPAELWSTGAAQQSLGHHHPVVVRSLERYVDTFLSRQPWIERWGYLRAHGNASDVIELISWPSMETAKPSEISAWVIDRPTLACLGLSKPYDQLSPDIRRAVDEAMFTEGVPVVLWRRGPGTPHDLIEALREHQPLCLTELPEVVFRCRKAGRIAEEHDVRNHITLLWEDPECVDNRQDSRFAGML
ncbi:hypothetical protein ACFVU3_39170 [Streptomyces sp. NPDC058052]|uniref:VMAP-C domain-containing protein n=1 Tax=Streptomyces sp. NPDC058052 TaxID=3346316 RepID=UPI0036E98B1E